MSAEGNEIVTLSQLKTLGDSIVTDITARLAVVNGTTGNVDVQLDTLDSTKESIRTAIVGKGVEVPGGTAFADYPAKIAEISTGIELQRAHGYVSSRFRYSRVAVQMFESVGSDNLTVNYVEEGNSLSFQTFIGALIVFVSASGSYQYTSGVKTIINRERIGDIYYSVYMVTSTSFSVSH